MTNRPPWPPELGPDTPTQRARVYCRAFLDILNACPDQAAREKTAQTLALIAVFGDDTWLNPPPVDSSPGERLTPAQVAALAGVGPDAVRKWESRGLYRWHTRRHLTPGPDGMYDPDHVDDFLDWRRATGGPR